MIRIWYVSMVLTLMFNSFANSEALNPLPIKEKISSSRSLRLLMSEPCEFLVPAAKLLRIKGNTLAPTYGRPVEISSNALSSSGASSILKYPRAPARNARCAENASVCSERASITAVGFRLRNSLINCIPSAPDSLNPIRTRSGL